MTIEISMYGLGLVVLSMLTAIGVGVFLHGVRYRNILADCVVVSMIILSISWITAFIALNTYHGWFKLV